MEKHVGECCSFKTGVGGGGGVPLMVELPVGSLLAWGHVLSSRDPDFFFFPTGAVRDRPAVLEERVRKTVGAAVPF